jgi:hypothetical protein
VKNHQKILILIALIGLLSVHFRPDQSNDIQCDTAESHLPAAFSFDVPEPFSAALIEQSRIPLPHKNCRPLISSNTNLQ